MAAGLHPVWEYQDATGTTRKGVSYGFSDHGGTDVTYRFHRLSDDGKPIRFENGGKLIDCVSGARLKSARRVGSISPADYAA